MPDRTTANRACVIRSAGLSFLLCLALAVASVVGAGLAPTNGPVHDYLLGLAVGLTASTLVLLVLVVRGARGHDTIFSRGMTGQADERDLLVHRRAWALTGVVGLVAVLVGTLLNVLGLGGSSVLPVISVLMTVTLIGARVHYDRTI